MGFRKGTGFTNLNKVMTANRGNKLGSTVAGGINTQTQGVTTGIQTAQQKFQEEADKNRLDSEENKKKREATLGKFNQANYAPDESKFQVSSGLQSDYDKQKSDVAGQQSAFQAQQKQQTDSINAKIAADKAALASAQNRKLQYSPWEAGRGMGNKDTYKRQARNSFKQRQKQDIRGYTASTGALQNLLNSQTGYGQSEEARYGELASGADTDFSTKSAAEKAQYLTSERDRMMSENAPSEQEINDVNKFRIGAYAGPKELKDQMSLQAKAQQAEQAGGLTRSSGGRQELLSRFVGGTGDYTQGQKQLDETLLGQDASGLRAAAKGARGSEQKVSEASQQAAGLGKELVGRAKIFGEETGQQVQAARSPFSDILNKKVTDTQSAEAARTQNQSGIQDLLTGTGDQYKGLEGITRTGLGLQQAMNQGYLSQDQASQLLGDKGLIARGQAAGLDINKLLGERLSGTAAQNISRTGVASQAEIARLNALDRMSGKQGSDLEFLEGQGKFAAGKTGFDINSLQDYIARTEAEKMPAGTQGASAQAGTPSYLQGALGGVSNVATGLTSPSGLAGGAVLGGSALGGLDLVGAGGGAGVGESAAAGGPAAIAAMLAADTLTGSDSTAKTTQAGIDTGLNTAGAGLQGKNAILEGLAKLNIGGASNPAQKQLLAAIQGMSNQENKALQGSSTLAKDWTDSVGGLTSTGLKDIASGNISRLADNAYGAVGFNSGQRLASDIGKSVSTALGGGKTGGWATSDYNTADATTGKKTKIREYANKDSQTILNQMRSMIGRSSAMGKGGAEVAKSINELNKYYQNALSNEQSSGQLERTVMSDEKLKKNIDYSEKDVQSFMDRLKPASYDYKEEVQNDPRASKDRQLGVMAQDLEKSKLGKESVHDEDVGKVVDYKDLQPKMLASLAALNQRLNKMEGK